MAGSTLPKQFYGCKVSEKADLIFVNGNIFTADDSIPFASAIAVKSHNIIAGWRN